MSTAVSTSAEQFDALIIGSGQGGNPLAGALTAAGKKTALIERQDVGGTCINRGCTPTKTMVASARVAYLVRRAGDYGVQAGEPVMHMERVRERKRAIVESFRGGSEKRLAKAEVTLMRGEASFTGAGYGPRRVARGWRTVADGSADLHQHRHPAGCAAHRRARRNTLSQQ